MTLDVEVKQNLNTIFETDLFKMTITDVDTYVHWVVNALHVLFSLSAFYQKKFKFVFIENCPRNQLCIINLST